MAEQQYALVLNGAVVLDPDNTPVTTGFLTEDPGGYSERYPPGAKWLPIENVDSEPFDVRLHWRDTPTLEVRGDKVARIYIVRAMRQRA